MCALDTSRKRAATNSSALGKRATSFSALNVYYSKSL